LINALIATHLLQCTELNLDHLRDVLNSQSRFFGAACSCFFNDDAMSVGKHDWWEPVDLSGSEHSGSANLLSILAKVSLCTEAYGKPVSRAQKP